MRPAALASRGARALEEGKLSSWWLARRLGEAWASWARVERRVSLPRGAVVCGVGGATLGGSYKTPLVIAMARSLAERGENVAVVGHGYRPLGSFSRSGVARLWNLQADAVYAVGDDALWAARELSSFDVPRGLRRPDPRRRALAAAARRIADDSPFQSTPERLAVSILAVDAAAPWGAGRCPPAGDLRAPISSLVGATDLIAWVGATRDAQRPPELSRSLSTPSGVPQHPFGCAAAPLRVYRSTPSGVPQRLGSARLGSARLGDLAGSDAVARQVLHVIVLRVLDGVVGRRDARSDVVPLRKRTRRPRPSIARPARVLAALAAHGVQPVETRAPRRPRCADRGPSFLRAQPPVADDAQMPDEAGRHVRGSATLCAETAPFRT